MDRRRFRQGSKPRALGDCSCLRGRLAQVAAPLLGVPAEQVIFKNDIVSGGGKALPFGASAGAAAGAGAGDESCGCC